MFDTSIVLTLQDIHIVGAWDWWDYMSGAYFNARFGRLVDTGKHFDNWLTATKRAGERALARQHAGNGPNINDLQWSLYQRFYLHHTVSSTVVHYGEHGCFWGSVSCSRHISETSKALADRITRITTGGF